MSTFASLLRWLPLSRTDERPTAVLSPGTAQRPFHPYVFVEDDGTVRELHRREKELLETPFAPSDPQRPYIKTTCGQRNPHGSLRGFCLRSAVSLNVRIGYPPVEAPASAH